MQGARAAEARMHRFHVLDGVLDLEPARQRGHVGDEAHVVHHPGAALARIMAEHIQLAVEIGEPENGLERRGLAGAVRADQADDAAFLDVEIYLVECVYVAVVLAQGPGFEQCAHDLLRLPSSTAFNNSLGSRSSRSMRAMICGHSDFRNTSRSFFMSARLAPGLTNMPRPRRFSTRSSSTSAW